MKGFLKIFGVAIAVAVIFALPSASAAISCGDVDGDQEITVYDAMMVLDYCIGPNQASFGEWAADVNGDGEVNVLDVIGLLSYVESPDKVRLNCRLLCGDINGDKTVDMLDARDLLEDINTGENITCDEGAADVNCDKKVNTSDVIHLLYYTGTKYADMYELDCC